MTDKALFDDAAAQAAAIRLAAAERDATGHIEDMARLHTYARSLEKVASRAIQDRRSLSWRVTGPLRWLERTTTGRKPSLPLLPLSDSPRRPRIIFVNGCTEGESQRYRVRNLISGLRKLNVSCTEIMLSECRRIFYQDMKPEVVVFFRSLNNSSKDYSDVVKKLTLLGTKVFFDIDDYIINPEILDQIDSYRRLDLAGREAYKSEVLGYLSMMRLCGRATAATPHLATAMESLGVKTHSVTNSFNDAQLARSIELNAQEKRTSEKFRVSYLSGSATHGRDFQECGPALLKFIKTNSNAIFTLVGFLDLTEEWECVSSQVEKLPFMGYVQTLDVLKNSDLTIACLDERSEFCQSKSELKYFESALVKTPILASRTSAYRSAIDDGHNGLLASSHSEWLEKLEAVFSSPSLGQAIGDEAHTAVLHRYSETYAARQALAAYGISEHAA